MSGGELLARVFTESGVKNITFWFGSLFRYRGRTGCGGVRGSACGCYKRGAGRRQVEGKGITAGKLCFGKEGRECLPAVAAAAASVAAARSAAALFIEGLVVSGLGARAGKTHHTKI